MKLELRDRTGERHRAHFESADIIDALALKRIECQLREQRRALGIEHGRLQVEVEIALAAGSERDVAAAERALADDVAQPRA